VKQQYICPAENVVVDRSEIVKGYEFRKRGIHRHRAGGDQEDRATDGEDMEILDS